MSLRIATFNVENLMTRFDFAEWRKMKKKAVRDRLSAKELSFVHEDDARQMTALAIADCHCDIICLQEVEDLATLETFETDYLFPLTGLEYPQKVWVEGNDTRGIDVALMARNETADGEAIEIKSVVSHRKKTFAELGVHTNELLEMGFEPRERLFRRDCLEVNARIGGKWVTFFVCHFKSMGTSKEGKSGREVTMPVRLAEARGVRRIIEEKFGPSRTDQMRWLICGDLNDYTERLVIHGDRRTGYSFELLAEATSGLEPLMVDGFSEDLVKRREGDNRWSLYYASGASRDVRRPDQRAMHHLVQLDYLLASPALARANPKALPHVVRQGLPLRTVFPPDQDVDRYPRIGWDRPKASDHCPVAVTLKIV